jgi:hypothetical protein
VQAAPQAVGITSANWNWKVVQRFVHERFGRLLSRSSCFGYLHCLGFVVKRPRKRLLKADAAKREAFVAFYAALRVEAQATGARIIFVDGAHFRAQVYLRAMRTLPWVPALVDSTCPRLGEKVSYHSDEAIWVGRPRESRPIIVLVPTASSTRRWQSSSLRWLNLRPR